jgi:hypothetical protein
MAWGSDGPAVIYKHKIGRRSTGDLAGYGWAWTQSDGPEATCYPGPRAAGSRCWPVLCSYRAHLVFKWPERRANCHSGPPTQPGSASDSPRRPLL